MKRFFVLAILLVAAVAFAAPKARFSDLTVDNTVTIPDSSISGAKIQDNTIALGKIVPRTYTAPGNDNTTPGSGVRLTDNVVEAYGSSQIFSGALVISNGTYMTVIGGGLTGQGTARKYPLYNATNFYTTYFGNVRVYLWVESYGWMDVAVIGSLANDYIGINTSIVGYGQGGDVGVAGVIKAGNYGAGVEGRVPSGNSGAGNIGVYGVDAGLDNTNTGVYGYSSLGYGMKAWSEHGISPLLIVPSDSASAPSHAASKGSLWVTSAGVLYINTDGSTTWGKVGAQ